MRSEQRSVVAFAGRRIDAVDADPARFPLDQVETVRAHLRQLFTERAATAVVASAACGADLVALQLAHDLGLRARVVLPFAPDRFRESSVTDRPGDWGSAFDEASARARAAGDLVVLDDPGSGAAAYAAANEAILEEALHLARAGGHTAFAVIAWDGRSRGPDDLTEAFARRARERGMHVAEVPTVESELIG